MAKYTLDVYLAAGGVSRDNGEHRSGEFNTDEDALEEFRAEAADFRVRWGHRYTVISFTVYREGKRIASL